MMKYSRSDFTYLYSLDYADWGAAEEDAEDVNVWEDNWDDDNIEDDFSQQLR